MDVEKFFDHLQHGWLLRFLEHRIADKRVIRLIRKWLRAGVMDEGRWYRPEEGSPQGSAVSPLLANIYLHYVFDLWSKRHRRTQRRGAMIVVRYGDDMVVGFQHREEAEAFLQEVRTRFNDFGFSHTTMNWRGRPLISHDVVVNLIGATKTRSGLKVKARLDKRKYSTGIEVPDETMQALHLTPHEFHGEWDYTLAPKEL